MDRVVVRFAAGKWTVERPGDARGRSRHFNQRQAWEAAKRLARRHDCEAFLYGKSGHLREVYPWRPPEEVRALQARAG